MKSRMLYCTKNYWYYGRVLFTKDNWYPKDEVELVMNDDNIDDHFITLKQLRQTKLKKLFQQSN